MTERENDSVLVDGYIVDAMATIGDPAHRRALTHAITEVLENVGYRGHEFDGVQIDMRIGAVWSRKGNYDGGSLSPALSPSTYRNSGEKVYVQVSMLLDDVSGALAEFVDDQRRYELERAIRMQAANADAAREELERAQGRVHDADAELERLRTTAARHTTRGINSN